MKRYTVTGGELTVSEVETKTLSDLQRVISAGKPAQVINRFASMYAEGIADPHQKIKDEWYSFHSSCVSFDNLIAGVKGERQEISLEGAEETVLYWITPPVELSGEQQEAHREVIESRQKLEDGYTTPPVYDEDGVEITPEITVEGTPWLASLRGVQGAPDAPTFEVTLAEEVLTSIKSYKVHTRESAMKKLTVTTVSGKTFDADEVSQARMARAVLFGTEGETISWIMADNTVAEVTYEELKEAGRLSGEAQTQVWFGA